MPTIGRSSTTATILPRSHAFVRVAETWGDAWQYVPWLTPMRCVDAVAPEVGEADLLYEVGVIKREEYTSFATYNALDLKDWFIQILIQYPGYAPVPVWHGVVTETQMTLDRSGSLSGPQAMKAYGLGHLLDRQIISRARTWDGDATHPTKTIDWVPKVNERYRRGRTLHGNRSEIRGPDDVYVYQSYGESWTNLQYAQYTLGYLEDDIDWQITGDTDSLNELIGWHEMDHKSAWDILNTLIPRKNGLGFYCKYDGESSTVNLEVFTLTNQDVAYGESRLRANPHTTYFAMPTDFPAQHEVADIPFRVTSVGKYDTIRLFGERLWTVGSFCEPDGTLERGWTQDEEDDYLNAEGFSPVTDLEDNIAYRNSERFKRVYTTFTVPRDWNGTVLHQEDGGEHPLLCAMNADGTIDTQTVGDFWLGDKRFDSQTPFRTNVEYDQSGGIVDNNPEDSDPEFLPLKVWMYDAVSGMEHEADEKWHAVDRLNADYRENASVKAMHFRSLNNELGVEVHVTPRHYLAPIEEWEASAAPDERSPEFDWRNLVVTAAVRHDLRPTVEIQLTEGIDRGRVPEMHVPGVEIWYAAPGTMLDVDSQGQPVVIHSDNLTLRDDTAKLWAFAAFATAWFGVERQAIQIPIKRMGLFVPLGTYVTGLANVANWLPVNTCVTGRVIDFVNRTTTIETGHNAQDMIAPMMAEVGGVGGRARVSR